MRKILLLMIVMLGLFSCHSKGGKDLQLLSEKDLSGLTVAAKAGSCYDMELSKRNDIRLLLFNTEADMLQALLSGHADVMVQDETTFNSEICQEYGMKVAFRGEQLFPTALMFRKDDLSLIQAINHVQETLQKDGTMQTLKDFWLTDAYLNDKCQRHIPVETEGQPLRVACVINLAPISFMIEDQWYGLEIDIARALSTYLHRPLEFKLYDYTGLLALKNGTADFLLGCMFVTPEREQEFSFSVPYHSYHPAYYILDENSKRNLQTGVWGGIKNSFQKNLLQENRWKYLTSGLLETLKITFFAILLGAILGIGICLMTRSQHKWLREAAGVYNWFMAGIPILVLLLILFYIVFANSGLSPSVVAIIAFAMDFGAGTGKIYATSLDAIPRGQTEAGLALGFTKFQTFLHIILPQAVKRGLPLFQGQCISLLKGTSIVGYIAIQDLTRAGDLIRSRTFDPFIPLLMVTVLYFLLSWLIILLLKLVQPKTHAL